MTKLTVLFALTLILLLIGTTMAADVKPPVKEVGFMSIAFGMVGMCVIAYFMPEYEKHIAEKRKLIRQGRNRIKSL